MDSSRLEHLAHKFIVKILGLGDYTLSVRLTLALSLTLIFIPLTTVFVDRSIYPYILALQLPLLLLPLVAKNIIDSTTISVTRIIDRGIEMYGAKAEIILRNNSSNTVRVSVEEKDTDKVAINPHKFTVVIGPYGESTIKYNIYAPIGKHILKPPTIIVYDQIGLVGKEIKVKVIGCNEVRIKPRITELKILRGSLTTYPVIGEGFRHRLHGISYDFQGLREYIYGDPVKLIDWKTSARTQKLYVKEYAMESSILLVIGLMVDIEDFQGRPSNYELLARSISTLSYYLLLRGACIGLVIVSPGSFIMVPLGRGLKHIDNILNAFSEVPWSNGLVNITRFFSEITKIALSNAGLRTLLVLGEGSRKYVQEIVKNVRQSRLLGLTDISIAVLNDDKIAEMFTRLGSRAKSISSPGDPYELLRLVAII